MKFSNNRETFAFLQFIYALDSFRIYKIQYLYNYATITNKSLVKLVAGKPW